MTLSITDYLTYSVLGMCVVFFALILLMVIIKIITATVKEEQKQTPEAEQPDLPVKTPLKAPVLAPGSAGDVNLYGTDPKTAAMIMAIVADELQTPLNELRFISIKEVKR